MSKKKIALILGILLLISIIAVVTYAWFTWQSKDNTELTLTIGSVADVKFEEGNDIIVENIGPVLDYNTDGEITTFSFRNRSELELFTNITLNISNLPEELKEESFKYVLLSSSDNSNFNEVVSGNFKDKDVGSVTLVDNEPSKIGTTYYKFIIYIDGNMDNPVTMMNQTFTATLDVSLGERQTFSEIVMNLSQGDSWEPGASGVYATNSYTDEVTGETKYHDYRYIGANVNNYVSFNNDLYRIIGVFDDNTHGVTGQKLVKLIRSRILGAYAYGVQNDTSGNYSRYSNDFTIGNMNTLLNDNFYNKKIEGCDKLTYYDNQTDYRTNDCSDIIGYGIDETFRNYIENVTWYLYGYDSNSHSKQDFYTCERGGNGCTGANGVTAENKVKIQNKIGLMYVSDYMYASGYYASGDTTNASSSYYGNKNWLFKGAEWMITPRSTGSSLSFHVVNYGSVNYSSACYGFGARPTFYLTSSVYMVGGNGSFDNPYTIAME